MQLSTRGRYAVMALADMAKRDERQPDGEDRPTTLAEIAAAQCLSQCYLEQLFGRLRRACLVTSARGPGGGYRLARPAERITVAEILLAANEDLRPTRCHDGAPGCPGAAASGADNGKCLTHDLWAELGRHIDFFLGSITLADIIDNGLRGRACPAMPRHGANPYLASRLLGIE